MKPRQTWTPEKANAQRARSDALARTPHPDKKRCAVCGLWYKRVTFHVFQRHGMTAYEYKKAHGLPVSRGILSDKAREHLRALAYEQNAPENMKRAGERTRYTKDDPRTHERKPNAGKKFGRSDIY